MRLGLDRALVYIKSTIPSTQVLEKSHILVFFNNSVFNFVSKSVERRVAFSQIGQYLLSIAPRIYFRYWWYRSISMPPGKMSKFQHGIKIFKPGFSAEIQHFGFLQHFSVGTFRFRWVLKMLEFALIYIIYLNKYHRLRPHFIAVTGDIDPYLCLLGRCQNSNTALKIWCFQKCGRLQI